MDIETLKNENEELKKKLAIAKIWMEREVQGQVVKIAKKHLKSSEQERDDFFSENIDELITKRVSDFFGEILLLNIPAKVIDNIISAEISFHNMKEGPNYDGFAVVSSYNKALDILIESFITKGFRKYAHKKGQTILRKNDVLEKTLNLVVNKGYSLGAGRLFHILQTIKEKGELYDYMTCFHEYLEKFRYLEKTLLDKAFYDKFHTLINSEVLGRKRHLGNMNLKETKLARELFIGNFKDIESILFRLIETQQIDY